MAKQILRATVLLCLLQATLFGQGSPAPSAPANANEAADDYIIGPEDLLSIVVWKEPDLTNRVIVRPDGKIGIPLLNDVQAAGLTPRQLTRSLTDGLKAFVSGPNVSVIVAEIHSNTVYVTGAVNRPGPYVLGAPTTIVELLIKAGGLAEFAKAEEVTISRKEGANWRRIRFNYKQFFEGRDFAQNIPLRRGDIVFVP